MVHFRHHSFFVIFMRVLYLHLLGKVKGSCMLFQIIINDKFAKNKSKKNLHCPFLPPVYIVILTYPQLDPGKLVAQCRVGALRQRAASLVLFHLPPVAGKWGLQYK